MELKQAQKVLVVLPFSWDEKPTWYRNCVTSIQYTDTRESHIVHMEWFRTHYNATICWEDGDPVAWHITFPDQETYMECVLTWS